MTDPAKRERAALDVLDCSRMVGRRADVLRPRHRALVLHRPWPASRPGQVPETITGTGEDELAAMTDLRIRLDERRRAEKLAEIDRRGRAAFLEGAEERSRTVEGRPLTADELERVTKRYPEG